MGGGKRGNCRLFKIYEKNYVYLSTCMINYFSVAHPLPSPSIIQQQKLPHQWRGVLFFFGNLLSPSFFFFFFFLSFFFLIKNGLPGLSVGGGDSSVVRAPDS